AAVARRGGAREGIVAGADAGRRLAAVREPAGVAGLSMAFSREETVVHGRGGRPEQGMERKRRAGLVAAKSRTVPCRRAAVDGRPEPALSGRAGLVEIGLRGGGIPMD